MPPPRARRASMGERGGRRRWNWYEEVAIGFWGRSGELERWFCGLCNSLAKAATPSGSGVAE